MFGSGQARISAFEALTVTASVTVIITTIITIRKAIQNAC